MLHFGCKMPSWRQGSLRRPRPWPLPFVTHQSHVATTLSWLS
uniref:Uncharacterized protein n=1 Tax=Anguilla anguilla TaxID=7936 RepID=A0A0E9R6S7_ANGAN